MSAPGTYAAFPDGRRKAGISPKPDIAELLSMLVYAFTPQLEPGSAAHRLSVRRVLNKSPPSILPKLSTKHSNLRDSYHRV
jgi:hypothetical protein